MKKKIKIISQYIKDLSFENYSAQKGTLPKEKPTVHIDIKIKQKKLKPDHLEVTLILLLEAKNKTEKILLIEVSYATTFALTGLRTSDQEKRVVFIECPNMMFPFVRQILFNITQNSGFSPLTLDHIDFEELFDTQNSNYL